MKVLWIDDEHETLELIKDNALDNDIELVGFRSAEEALLQLEYHDVYDAVLLDGLFHMNKNDQGTPSNDAAFGKVASKIKSLKDRGIILPWFILSGKTNFTLNQSSMIEALSDKDYSNGRVFDKKKIEETILWEEIKKAVGLIPEYQMKQKYSDLLAICEDNLLGKKNYSRLFELIKDIEKSDKIKGGEDKLTTIRKTVEALFSTLGKHEIIPGEMVGQKGWINGSSLFLSGKHYDYPLQDDIIPSLVSNNIYKLLEIIQDGSHAYGELKYKVDSYMKEAQSDYFFRSCVYLLFDLLLWFKDFMIKNSDIEINKSRWKSIASNGDWIGKLYQDSDKNYFVNDHILPYKRVHNVYQIGTLMKITHSIDNTKTTSKMYKKFALNFEAIK